VVAHLPPGLFTLLRDLSTGHQDGACPRPTSAVECGRRHVGCRYAGLRVRVDAPPVAPPRGRGV